MLKTIVFLFLGAVSISHAEMVSTELEYQNSTIRFHVVKSKSDLRFSDELGERTLKIRKCNKTLVEKFWQDLIQNVGSLQSETADKTRKPSSGAWVKYEGLYNKVLDFEPALKFFNKVPSQSHVLFVESKILCKDK